MACRVDAILYEQPPRGRVKMGVCIEKWGNGRSKIVMKDDKDGRIMKERLDTRACDELRA